MVFLEYDMRHIINEWCTEAPHEVDFRIESQNTATVASNLKALHTAPRSSGDEAEDDECDLRAMLRSGPRKANPLDVEVLMPKVPPSMSLPNPATISLRRYAPPACGS